MQRKDTITAYRPGDVIASLYEVKEVFNGGMGEVYVAYHRERKRLYAVKTIQEKYFCSKDEFLGFKREVEVWIMLGKHPNIVQAISVRDFEGRLFLVLEYIVPDSKGRTNLSDYLIGEPLKYEQCLSWAIQFCDGMSHAREKGLKCHRDISPDNIMITRDLVAKVSDFGISKLSYHREHHDPAGDANNSSLLDRRSLGEYEVTLVGYVRGKAPYMAPEIFTDYRNADEVSDIYSFGIVFYQMLTGGERPFKAGVAGRDIFAVYGYLHRNSPVPELDNPLFPIVRKCLSKDKGERYQSFSELRTDLEVVYRRLTNSVPPSAMEATMDAEDIRHFSHALFELKRYEDALRNCDRALAIDQNDHEAWNLMGRILHALGKGDEAIKAFEKTIAIKPDYFAPWNNKGMIYQERGHTKHALSCFNKVTSLRPNYREAWNNIGCCLQMQGNLGEAIKHYRMAIELDSRYRDAWLNMGDCHIKLQEFEKALQCYERAVAIDPYDSYAIENLEKIYRFLGRTDEADIICKDSRETRL